VGRTVAVVMGVVLVVGLLAGAGAALPGGMVLFGIFVTIPAILLVGIMGERLTKGKKR
jgi:hypothetical protein